MEPVFFNCLGLAPTDRLRLRVQGSNSPKCTRVQGSEGCKGSKGTTVPRVQKSQGQPDTMVQESKGPQAYKDSNVRKTQRSKGLKDTEVRNGAKGPIVRNAEGSTWREGSRKFRLLQ